MAGELDLVECQTAFLAPGAQVAGTRESAAVVLGVVWRVEWCIRVRLQALKPVPLSICISDWPFSHFGTPSHCVNGLSPAVIQMSSST